jgi:hypothetical protein
MLGVLNLDLLVVNQMEDLILQEYQRLKQYQMKILGVLEYLDILVDLELLLNNLQKNFYFLQLDFSK